MITHIRLSCIDCDGHVKNIRLDPQKYCYFKSYFQLFNGVGKCYNFRLWTKIP